MTVCLHVFCHEEEDSWFLRTVGICETSEHQQIAEERYLIGLGEMFIQRAAVPGQVLRYWRHVKTGAILRNILLLTYCMEQSPS
jgi:hypothetical protein